MEYLRGWRPNEKELLEKEWAARMASESAGQFDDRIGAQLQKSPGAVKQYRQAIGLVTHRKNVKKETT